MKKHKLTVIIANKFLYPRGGDCLYTLRLMDLLSKAGHTVIPFSMHHPQNYKTAYDDYFVPHIDFRDELKHAGIKNALKVLSRAIANFKAANLMQKLIEKYHPDIIHLNNIHHQLTPAILSAPAKYNIPVVWTLHDNILNCPDNTFLRNGKICTKCADGNNIHAIVHRCKKGSLGASVIAALESTIYNPRKLAGLVKKFIAPSRFLADILVNHGLPQDQVTNIPNFLPSLDINSTGNDYFLYIGRLSSEKGVDILLDAFSRLKLGKLIIAGDGPDRGQLEKKALEMNIENVEFVGHQPPEKIIEFLAGCLAVILPSICWENFPYSIMEAMAFGKPVIGSRMGGIPEQIEHDKTGLIFSPGNVEELARGMNKLLNNQVMAIEMGMMGKQKALKMYSPETHYENIINIYQEVIDNNNINNRYEKRELVSAI